MPTPVATTPTEITRTGVVPPSETTGDATNGHTVVNDGHIIILLHNTNGASTSRTATFAIPATVDGQAVTGRAVSVAASASKYVGPFPTTTYGPSLGITVDNAEMHFSAFHISQA